MSKLKEYNNYCIKKQEVLVKNKMKEYFNNECSYQELNVENKKLFNKYCYLEKLIDQELKNNK